jgi:hypothetical protein
MVCVWWRKKDIESYFYKNIGKQYVVESNMCVFWITPKGLKPFFSNNTPKQPFLTQEAQT